MASKATGNRESIYKRRRAQREGKIFGNAFADINPPKATMKPFLHALRDQGAAVGVSQGGSARRYVRGMSKSAISAAKGGIGQGGTNADSNSGFNGEDAAQH